MTRDSVVDAAVHVVALVRDYVDESRCVSAAQIAGKVGVCLTLASSAGFIADVVEQDERVVLRRVERIGARRPEVRQRIAGGIASK